MGKKINITIISLISIATLYSTNNSNKNICNSKEIPECTITSQLNTSEKEIILNTPSPIKYEKVTFEEYPTTLKSINEILEGKLENKGDYIIQVSKTNNVSPIFLTSIMIHESGNGKSPLIINKNNVAGMVDHEKGGFKEFDSIENSIKFLAEKINNQYIQEGFINFETIGEKYCPSALNPINKHWIPKVTKLYHQIKNNN